MYEVRCTYSGELQRSSLILCIVGQSFLSFFYSIFYYELKEIIGKIFFSMCNLRVKFSVTICEGDHRVGINANSNTSILLLDRSSEKCKILWTRLNVLTSIRGKISSLIISISNNKYC